MALYEPVSDETLTQSDPWLAPHREHILKRLEYTNGYAAKLLGGSDITEFALGHLYFGLHKSDNGWVLREWAPAATKIYVIGAFSDWKDDERYALTRSKDEWSIELPPGTLSHGDTYKLHIYWNGGDGYRVPAWARYVVQDPETHGFDAAVWDPTASYDWQHNDFSLSPRPIIYEAHIGMSAETESVSTYNEFTENVLPRIKDAGYNTVQLMAIAEHPYYGSFGYHVSSFFAPSSRFGTPDDLKKLVDTAHGMGLAVIMDIVHSHAVKNEAEGLSKYDGTEYQFFHEGLKGEHSQWDSRTFDYGKPEVTHFLLSNCRYWLDEFHMDGYRFDGVTSMLFEHHGLGFDFTSYDDYFQHVDAAAVSYLTLANRLIHDVKPEAITIAEDMSGFPGIAASAYDGGIGFDYRLNMGTPDLWIKYIKEKSDEDWNMSELIHELTQHRPEERTITYAESHDQALVGDKTLIFRLIDKDMYEYMAIGDENLQVDRGIALHKMIRLLTASLNHGGYLNFMGNEFGHPEWIDFPREGNGWSYKYARRQWSLRDDPTLKYKYLADFDASMTALLPELVQNIDYVTTNDDDHVVSYIRGNYLFVYNFHPSASYTAYGVHARAGGYEVVLSSDDATYGGFDRIDTVMEYHTDDASHVRLYLPSRTAIVLKMRDL